MGKLAKGLVLLGLGWLIMSLARPSQAQGSNPTLVIETIETKGFPKIEVVVSVMNTGRAPIQGLVLQDFEVLEDKKPLAIPEVNTETPSEQPIAVALVIDLSGSAPLDQVKVAAKQFLTSLRPQDHVALIGFNTPLNLDTFDPFKEADFTDNKEILASIIDNFSTVGESAVYEAILKGALITAKENTTRRAVLVMSDGHDTKSRAEIAPADAPEKAARDAKIPIFTVGISSDKFPANLDYLAALASKTGGRYQLAASPDDLGFLFESVSEQLRQQYALMIQVDQPPDGKEHTLTFRANTPDGQAIVDKIINYPAPPTIPQILNIQQEINRALQPMRPELKGQVLLVPTITALNPIVKVEYALDGKLIETINAQKAAASARYQPWEWLWDTSLIAAGKHKLSVKAYDDSNNISTLFETEIQVTPLTGLETATVPATEAIATVTPVVTTTAAVMDETIVAGLTMPYILLLLGGSLLLLVILLAIAFWLFNRTRQPAPSTPVEEFKPWGGVTDNMAPVLNPTWEQTQPERMPTSVSHPRTVPKPPDWGTVDPPTTIGMDLSSYGISDNDKTEILLRTNRLPTTGLLIVQESVGKLGAGQTFPLTERINTIGRMEDNHIMLDDNSVSRHHARIVLDGMVFRLEDLKSANGLKVNGEKVASQLLKENDRIELGRIKLIFIILSREDEKK